MYYLYEINGYYSVVLMYVTEIHLETFADAIITLTKDESIGSAMTLHMHFTLGKYC